jgi:phosphoenolpyruvate carboxylase
MRQWPRVPDENLPMPAAAESAESPPRRAKDEQHLREDIRLLGRILGDTVREQEGAPAFELVEGIRKLSVAFRRDADHDSDQALKTLLKSLSAKQAVSVIRAFTYFSHLAPCVARFASPNRAR